MKLFMIHKKLLWAVVWRESGLSRRVCLEHALCPQSLVDDDPLDRCLLIDTFWYFLVLSGKYHLLDSHRWNRLCPHEIFRTLFPAEVKQCGTPISVQLLNCQNQLAATEKQRPVDPEADDRILVAMELLSSFWFSEPGFLPMTEQKLSF